MAMFARRALQAMIFDLEPHVSLEGREKLVRELNQKSRSALAFEWETAVLFALSKVGKVEYETGSSGGSQPDIAFVEDSPSSPISFTADVTAVSDQGLEEENPTARFSMAVIRLQRKYKLPGTTNIKIEGEAKGPEFRDRKMRVYLPPGKDVDEWVRKYVGPMFERIQKEKLETISIEVNEPDVKASVTYNAKQRYGSVSYPSYRVPYSLTRNPVHRALKAKLKQLKASGRPGPLGVFLCDGDCELLKSTSNHVSTVSLDQVIGEFFRDNSSLSFVAALTFLPPEPVPVPELVKVVRVTGRVIVNPKAKHPINREALKRLLDRGIAQIPAALGTPLDALYWLEHGKPNQGEPLHKIIEGSRIMGQSLKISARKIQEVLAGRMTAEALWSEYQRPGSKIENPFQRALKSGFMIQSAKVTRVPEADDDLIEFDFGPDVAIGKIVAAKASDKSSV